MKRFAAFASLAMCICLFYACSAGSGRMAKQTARDELVKYHIPQTEQLYLDDIPENSVLGRNVAELLNNKNFVKSDSLTAYDTYYLLDDANRRIGTVMHHHFRKYYKITIPVVKTKVGEITEISDDSQNKMATVMYTITLEPLEPYYSKLCIDPACSYYGEGLKKTSRKNMDFKQSGAEWKIDR